jgi:hypothetical protein
MALTDSQITLRLTKVVDLAHSYYEHLAAPKHQQDRNDQALFEALGRLGLKDDDNAQRITIHKVTHLWRAKRPEEIISAESTNSRRPLKL